LPAKFETGKLPSSQGALKLLFLASLIAAKRTGNLFQVHPGRMRIAVNNIKPLIPCLLPVSRGEGDEAFPNRKQFGHIEEQLLIEIISCPSSMSYFRLGKTEK
jgi:hypothetical protein